MPRKAKELSALEVNRLKVPGLWAVGGVAGLYLQVGKSGARSWILRAVVANKRRDHGLGGFPDVTLGMVREKARRARESIEQGQDPIAQRKQAISAAIALQATEKTFEEAARAYIDAHSDGWKNVKHRAQWSATLETYVFPSIGRLLVSDIGQVQVLNVLEKIWKTKTETASRLRGRIESVLAWAAVRGHRSGDNPARWKGHLDQLLPAPGKIKKVEHHRALPIDGMGAFIQALRQREGIAARALEFTILTAARSGETRGAVWEEIDLDLKIWTIPAARMKAGREHRVPLAESTILILNSLFNYESGFIFASPRGGQISDMSMTGVLRRMEVDAVPHGFRSTFRDWAAERTNYPRDMAEQALAHTLTDAVEAAYRRGDMLEKRRLMMQDWEAFCENSTKTGKVVSLLKKTALR